MRFRFLVKRILAAWGFCFILMTEQKGAVGE